MKNSETPKTTDQRIAMLEAKVARLERALNAEACSRRMGDYYGEQHARAERRARRGIV